MATDYQQLTLMEHLKSQQVLKINQVVPVLLQTLEGDAAINAEKGWVRLKEEMLL